MRRQGFALVTALVLMIVLSLVGGILLAGTVGELNQSRSSLQVSQARAAAEAGATYGQIQLASSAQASMESILAPYVTAFLEQGKDPSEDWVIPPSAWSLVAASLASNLNGGFSTFPATTFSDDFPAGVTLQYSIDKLRGASLSNTLQTYVADYTITSTGSVLNGRRRVEDKGSLTIPIGRGSLSQYLFLVDDAQGDRGFFPTGSVFNGPVHANENWGFWGRPQFLDTASTSQDGAYYWSLSSRDGCSGAQRLWIAGDSRPPCTVPLFSQGFTRNADEIELPTTSLSQQRAALGLNPQYDNNGDGSPDAPGRRAICTALGFTDCNDSSTIPDGVYLVNDGTNVSGGLYVQGDLDELTLSASGDGKQVYEFRQGSTSWEVTVDYAANTTTVVETAPSLGTPATYQGTPNGPAPANPPNDTDGGATGQIYVTGSVRSFGGPARTGTVSDDAPDHPPPDTIPPALSVETQLTVTARNDIGLTADLVYECDPTQVEDDDYVLARPRCASATQLTTVLGVMSEDGNVIIENTPKKAPDNIFLWGSYLAGTSGKGLTVENYSSRGSQGKMRLFGGLIQSNDQLRGNGTLASGFIATFDFDRRFENSRLAPPNFPTVRTFSVQALRPVELSFREY
jgi:type II secretory pathway pseudopilin PulG